MVWCGVVVVVVLAVVILLAQNLFEPITFLDLYMYIHISAKPEDTIILRRS